MKLVSFIIFTFSFSAWANFSPLFVKLHKMENDTSYRKCTIELTDGGKSVLVKNHFGVILSAKGVKTGMTKTTKFSNAFGTGELEKLAKTIYQKRSSTIDDLAASCEKSDRCLIYRLGRKSGDAAGKEAAFFAWLSNTPPSQLKVAFGIRLRDFIDTVCGS